MLSLCIIGVDILPETTSDSANTGVDSELKPPETPGLDDMRKALTSLKPTDATPFDDSSDNEGVDSTDVANGCVCTSDAEAVG